MTSCWLWSGSYFPNGYGQAWSRALKRGTQAHRLVYETLVGPIPDGLSLDHLCRVKGCVNPDHLRAVTQRENLFAPGSQALALANAAKERCPKGHSYTAENTYRRRGRRYCRICKRADKVAHRISARGNRPVLAAARIGREESCNAGSSLHAVLPLGPPEADGRNSLGIK